jgi:hypothetical protein
VLFAYGINRLIDLQAEIIVDFQATPARFAKHTPLAATSPITAGVFQRYPRFT